MDRRVFLGTALTTINLPLALSLGLLQPTRALGGWPADAFSATTLDDALNKLTGGRPTTSSNAIKILAREIAEDGSSVPVSVESGIPDTKSITLLSEKNPNPTVARFTISPRVQATVDTRIKMGGTGDIVALVESDDGFYVARKRINVTAGGCG
ncbi:MAG: thiosulfate oxidation carrier protein SoxY [Gammaproteobacteria bacterium]|nr:thiosulfate oxidation carrier protein SoxY [Gammaproteobacteria bacterium]MCB1873574.1 thiosulfate oxidation carrier protein SoxY [Gammaproteobacteria bacterium]